MNEDVDVSDAITMLCDQIDRPTTKALVQQIVGGSYDSLLSPEEVARVKTAVRNARRQAFTQVVVTVVMAPEPDVTTLTVAGSASTTGLTSMQAWNQLAKQVEHDQYGMQNTQSQLGAQNSWTLSRYEQDQQIRQMAQLSAEQARVEQDQWRKLMNKKGQW